MPTYVRRNADGDVVERVEPEAGSLEDQRLNLGAHDEASPWQVDTEQPADPVDEAPADPAPTGRPPRGARSSSGSSSSASSTSSTDEGEA